MKPVDFEKLITEKLGKKIPEKRLSLLPSGFQKIGNIVILNLPDELHEYSRMIGRVVLKNYPHTRTVAMRLGGVGGELKKPEVSVIAGEKSTITMHRENRCLYRIDVAKLMFSKGNIHERGRLSKLVEKWETVVDMFAGIGYFSIPIARHAKPKKIFAIEKNPVAIEYLKENIKLNKVDDRMTPVFGDCRQMRFGDIGDRILMGYLPDTRQFLPVAFEALKPEGGMIHYHDNYHKTELWEKPVQVLETAGFKHGYTLEKIHYKNIIKEHSPNVLHVVLDAEFSDR